MAPINLQAPVPALTKSCARPVVLAEREMDQQDVEVSWAGDRAALRTCSSRLDALVGFYRDRDAALVAGIQGPRS